MKLKTQFAFLTIAVSIVPIIFSLFFFSAQQRPHDMRVPTKVFLQNLQTTWRKAQALTMSDVKKAAEKAKLPLKEAAIVSFDGKVLDSNTSYWTKGLEVGFDELGRLPSAFDDKQPAFGDKPPERSFNYMQLLPVDGQDTFSPYVLFNTRPFWSKQDLRNRTMFTFGALILLVFAVTGILSLVILRSTSRAIRQIQKDTAIVATGNLDYEVKSSSLAEFSSIASSINAMRLTLKEMLERRNRMLMGISHDLKTPIALIQGYADALADNVADDEATRAKYIEIIQSKSRQLEDLSVELIDLLKIGGDGTTANQAVDPAVLLKDLGRRFGSDADLMKRRFRWGYGCDCAAENPWICPSVSMNRLLVERALENLVMNAFRFSAPESLVRLYLEQTDTHIHFCVLDEGSGIAQDDVPYVFDAFYRASPSREDGGHGLGLTIVKAVVELHNWELSLKNRSDGISGSEARVSIPLSKNG